MCTYVYVSVYVCVYYVCVSDMIENYECVPMYIHVRMPANVNMNGDLCMYLFYSN